MNLLVLGDLCLSESDNREELPDLLAGVRPLLNGQSRLIANLECAITQSQEGMPFKWATLKAPPTGIVQLEGLDVAILANNHIGDFGSDGAAETIEVLNAAGKKWVGYGKNLGQALSPLVLEGDEGRVAIVALVCPTTNSGCLATHDRPGVAPLSTTLLRRAIEAAHRQSDSVMVYMHWGAEQCHDPVPDQIRLARLAIDWGASIVIGSHAHVIQGYEQYGAGWIFYGLGNFSFPSVETKEILDDGTERRGCYVPIQSNRQSLAIGLTLQATADGKRLIPSSITPFEFQAGGIPRPIEKSDLTIPLDAVNDRIRRYGELYWRRLHGSEEPEYRSTIRNGIPTYVYSDPPISDEELRLSSVLSCHVYKWRDEAKRLIKRIF